nr:MAG TPA: hypothetical protein [Caudoviricetes sp.]
MKNYINLPPCTSRAFLFLFLFVLNKKIYYICRDE